jgi:hypothetical protein
MNYYNHEHIRFLLVKLTLISLDSLRKIYFNIIHTSEGCFIHATFVRMLHPEDY